MARKLFVMWVAIISLALLVQAAPVSAVILPTDPFTYVESFQDAGGDYTPGALESTFIGGHTWTDGGGGWWEIGESFLDKNTNDKPLTNTEAAIQEDLGDSFFKFTYTYDTIVEGGSVKFRAEFPDEGLDISSTSVDTQITITATYKYQNPGWDFQEGYMEGIVINDADGMPYKLSAYMYVDYGDHTKYGHFITDQEDPLSYGLEVNAVPVPGAVWLLGSGLVGLFCLGRRRKD